MSQTAEIEETNSAASSQPTINGVPARIAPSGGLLKSGNPGNKGGPGGHNKSLRKHLAELRRDSEVQAAIQRAARAEYSKHWPAAMKMLTDYDPNKPAERREMSGQVTISVVVEREGPRRNTP